MLTPGSNVSVITRVDLSLYQLERIVRSAQHLPLPDGTAADAGGSGDGEVYRALVALVAEYGGDLLADHARRFGLVAGNTSVVLVQPEDDADWQTTWPPAVDRARIMLHLETGLAWEAAEYIADRDAGA